MNKLNKMECGQFLKMIFFFNFTKRIKKKERKSFYYFLKKKVLLLVSYNHTNKIKEAIHD